MKKNHLRQWVHTSYSFVFTVNEGTRANNSFSAFKIRGLVSQLSFGDRAFHVERMQTT